MAFWYNTYNFYWKNIYLIEKISDHNVFEIEMSNKNSFHQLKNWYDKSIYTHTHISRSKEEIIMEILK